MARKRIIQLSTGHLGGAGIAARNLNYGLTCTGVHSTFVATSQESFQLTGSEREVKRSLSKTLLGKTNSLANKLISEKSVFTLRSSSSNLEQILQIAGSPEETILHIHNWFNLISIRDIEKLLQLGFQLVFTLHDERLLTGGCHSTLGCNLYKTGCIRCPEINSLLHFVVSANLKAQKSLFKRYGSQVTFIAPSKWIFNQANSVCEDLGINLLMINNFIPAPENEELLHLQISKKSLVLGVANVDPKSFIKGGDRINLINSLIKEHKLAIDWMDLRNYSEDSTSKEYFWKNIDFLLITSRSENSPNIIFEAKGFGVPVLATDVGGIRELLNLDYDVFLDFSFPEIVLAELQSLKNRARNYKLARKQVEWAKSRATDSLKGHSELYSSLSE